MGPREEAGLYRAFPAGKGKSTVRNSGGKQCPRGLDAGPVKVHLSDTDEVTGGTGEDGGKWQGNRLDTIRGSRGEREVAE